MIEKEIDPKDTLTRFVCERCKGVVIGLPDCVCGKPDSYWFNNSVCYTEEERREMDKDDE